MDAYLIERPRRDDAFTAVFESTTLLLIPPVIDASDGSIRIAVAGDDEDLDGLPSTMPEEFSATVERVGECETPSRRRRVVSPSATERGVRAAVEAGYYAVSRDGSVEAVAERLDCAPSTAADHLRKVEVSIVTTLVDAGRLSRSG